MGLLDREDLTEEQIKFEVQSQLNKKMRSIYKEVCRKHKNMFEYVWENPKLTAQEIFDVYGTQSAELFIFSGSIQQLLVQIDSDYVPIVPPLAYTVNADGTVTVNENDPS